MTLDEHKRALWRLLRVLIGGSVVASLLSWTNGQCFEPAYKVATSSGDFGCVEFWLNRYQQLIGTALAVAAAGAAWLMGQRQIRTMRRQTLPDDRNVAREIAADFEQAWESGGSLAKQVARLSRELTKLDNDASEDFVNRTSGLTIAIEDIKNSL